MPRITGHQQMPLTIGSSLVKSPFFHIVRPLNAREPQFIHVKICQNGTANGVNLNNMRTTKNKDGFGIFIVSHAMSPFRHIEQTGGFVRLHINNAKLSPIIFPRIVRSGVKNSSLMIPSNGCDRRAITIQRHFGAYF